MPDPNIVMKEVAALGWDKVLDISADMKQLTLSMLDSAQRSHVVVVSVPADSKGFKFAATVPVTIPTIHRSNAIGHRLKAAYYEYLQELDKFTPFWHVSDTSQSLLRHTNAYRNQMDELDKHAWVMEPDHPTRADTTRRLALGKNCSLVIEVDPTRPFKIPIMRFLGAETPVSNAKQLVNSNLSKWLETSSLRHNLETILETTLPTKPTDAEETESMDCGICYDYKLEEDDRVAVPEEMCNNEPCGKPYHYTCLVRRLAR